LPALPAIAPAALRHGGQWAVEAVGREHQALAREQTGRDRGASIAAARDSKVNHTAVWIALIALRSGRLLPCIGSR